MLIDHYNDIYFHIEESSKEKESRNGTEEKTNRHLETNTTAVVSSCLLFKGHVCQIC